MNEIMENMKIVMPITIAAWAVFAYCVIRGKQRIRNSFVLLCALLITTLPVAALAGKHMREALLAEFMIIMIVIILVPLFLIQNGIVMSVKEGRCMANRMSMFLGVAIAGGEACFIASFMLIGPKGSNPIWLKIMATAGWSAFFFCVVFLSFVLYVIAVTALPHDYDYDYIIIHGCGLIGGEKVSKLLSNRIDTALETYRRCLKRSEKMPVIIPSGGRGDDEKMSEAEAMARYMIERHVPEDGIIMEDKSPSTRTNLINSMKIVNELGGGKVALVSSNYHVYRCLALAKELDFKCTGIGAPVAQYFWPSAVIREFVAVYSDKKKNFWLMLFWVIDIALLWSVL